MKEIEISINPFAEYLEATEKRRQKILSEQMDPDPVRIPYYQRARGAMSKFILIKDQAVLNEARKMIMSKIAVKNWQKHDKKNSMAAISKFEALSLPTLVAENELSLVRTKYKFLRLFGVAIKISPNAIYTAKIDGKVHIGACKIHVSKGKPFSVKQSKLVATLIYQFISEWVAEEDWYVDPNMCFCIDPFAGTTVTANSQFGFHMKEVKELCKELPAIWDQAKMEFDEKVA